MLDRRHRLSNTSMPNRDHQKAHWSHTGEALRVTAVVILALLAGIVTETSAVASTQYILSVLSLAPDDVFFDDECYYDFNNSIWGDIDSEFNDNWSDNDPDFLRTGEYALSHFFYEKTRYEDVTILTRFDDYEYWADSRTHPLGTFGPYRYPKSLEHGDEDQASEAFGDVINVIDHNYRFKLTYGCRNGKSNWEDVNDEAQVKVSSVFDLDQGPYTGNSSVSGQAVAFAVIADCDGTIGWGETFYEAYDDAMGVSDSDWSSWHSESSEDSDGNDQEPLYEDVSGWSSHGIPPGQVKDIQCRQADGDSVMREEWLARTGISSPRVHTCSVEAGFSCQASEQIELYDHSEEEYWTPSSCGNWEIRTLRYDKELININANTLGGGHLRDGTMVVLALSGTEAGDIYYNVKSDETSKYVWTAQLSHTINNQTELDVKAGQWQSTGLAVRGSQYLNSVWGYTSNTTAIIEVFEPYLIGQISGPNLSAGDVVTLFVRKATTRLWSFSYEIPNDYWGKNWRWPVALAKEVNAHEDISPVRAGEYSGTALTYPASTYRNKVWLPDDDPVWNVEIVIDYN